MDSSAGRVGSDTVLGAGDARKRGFIYLDETAVTESPSRDYYRIIITNSKVSLTEWRISHSRKNVPVNITTSLIGWNKNSKLLDQVIRAYGNNMVDYINGLCIGKVDWINVLPDEIFVKIFDMIGIKQLHVLSPVSKRFRRVCSSNELWESFFRRYRGRLSFEYHVENHAKLVSWKRLFFIKRLQDNVYPGQAMVFGHRPDNEFRQFANQLRMPEEKRPWALQNNKGMTGPASKNSHENEDGKKKISPQEEQEEAGPSGAANNQEDGRVPLLRIPMNPTRPVRKFIPPKRK